MVGLKEKQTKKKKETKSVSETGLSPLYYLVKTVVWNCLLKFQSDQNPLETVFPGIKQKLWRNMLYYHLPGLNKTILAANKFQVCIFTMILAHYWLLFISLPFTTGTPGFFPAWDFYQRVLLCHTSSEHCYSQRVTERSNQSNYQEWYDLMHHYCLDF